MVNMENITKEDIIKHFELLPLPGEGGYFRQNYCAKEQFLRSVLPGHYNQDQKPYSTAIFYFLTDEPDCFSELHRLPTDEIFHFYLGDPMETLLLYPDHNSRRVIIGQNFLQNQHLQFVVPAGVWQGSRVLPGGRFSLIGTTMAPGYNDADYEKGEWAVLSSAYPQEAELIRILTR
ncbi:MAG: cupin domain-containing protein [Anaerolineaceae bacterium]|nr:cupin domain-containing protein [Anaerolineaceae bacterium]